MLLFIFVNDWPECPHQITSFFAGISDPFSPSQPAPDRVFLVGSALLGRAPQATASPHHETFPFRRRVQPKPERNKNQKLFHQKNLVNTLRKTAFFQLFVLLGVVSPRISERPSRNTPRRRGNAAAVLVDDSCWLAWRTSHRVPPGRNR